MTIKWKIGTHYLTRGGSKVQLFGIARGGELYFQFESGQVLQTHPDGRWTVNYENERDVISEWREPHKHEHFIWALTGIRANQDMSHVLGVDCHKWSSTQTDRWRKFKVNVEEILE